MFSFFSRLLQSLSRKPKAILIAVVIISIACIYPVFNLRWELQLSDMLQEDSRYPKTEDLKVGKLLPLSLVLESSDTLLLGQFAASLEKELQKNIYNKPKPKKTKLQEEFNEFENDETIPEDNELPKYMNYDD